MLNFLQRIFKKNYESLSAAAFKKQMEQNKQAVLIDVRSPVEFASEKIKGAKNINIGSADFQKKVAALDAGKTYFVYCRSGARSGAACSHMAAQGLQVVNLSGGLMRWPY